MEASKQVDDCKELPYGEIKRLLLSKDWSNYTNAEIAEELGVNRLSIKNAIADYKRTTGHVIPHADGRKRKRGSNGIH